MEEDGRYGTVLISADDSTRKKDLPLNGFRTESTIYAATQCLFGILEYDDEMLHLPFTSPAISLKFKVQ